MGTRRTQLANLPLEISGNIMRTVPSQYGEVQFIHDENWSKTYRYAVTNGIKMFTMTLTKHIPSHVTIAEYRALTSYDGQLQNLLRLR
jgi:hypothetical protein